MTLDSAGTIRDAIMSSSRAGNNFRLPCPACEPDRKQRGTKTLSVSMNGDHALYNCHHCDEGGRVNLVSDMVLSAPKKKAVSVPVPTESFPIPSRPESSESKIPSSQMDWFLERGISPATVEDSLVTSGMNWIRERNAEVLCVGFRYENADGSYATKWRDGQKNFSQSGAARSLWEIEKFPGGDLIIAEGEMDALSFREVGIWATSVPNGAPSAVSANISGQKYSYLWDARDAIESATRIILAVDADDPGNALAEEIARRVGRARCWRVVYPDDCKDVNDVLVKHGKEGVTASLESATPWPVAGLRNPVEFREEVEKIYTNGVDTGVSSGLSELDDLFRIMPQTFTVVTGVPGSGKSALLTWLMVQLASRAGWSSAVFCAETSTQIMILQLAAVHQEKSFRGHDKMSEGQLSESLDWIDDKFVFLYEPDTGIDSILERSHAAVLRYGVRILVVDPYNFITSDEGIESTTYSINSMLVKLKSFAVQHGLAIFLVAHPRKMFRTSDGSQPSPGGYDILGSAAFYNVCDTGLTVTREGDGVSRVSCWKSRFPWLGQTGECLVSFDRDTGMFGSGVVRKSSHWGDDDDEDFDFENL